MKTYSAAKIFRLTNYPYYFKQVIWRFIYPKYLSLRGVTVGRKVRLYGMPLVVLAPHTKINVGDNSVLCSVSAMTALGLNHPVVLRTLAPGAEIVIGRDTGISGGTICAAVSVKIGNECLIGANVVIADTDFHSLRPEDRRGDAGDHSAGTAPVIIEDNVFVGTGAIVLKGVRVGRNSVIGAGSVVTKSVPPNTIVAGNPATILRNIP